MEQHLQQHVAADPGIFVPEDVRTPVHPGQVLGTGRDQVEVQALGRLYHPARILLRQLGLVRAAGARATLVQAREHQHRVAHVHRHRDPLRVAVVDLQLVDEGAEIGVRGREIDLAQAHRVRVVAGCRRAQQGQAGRGDHRPGAVADHVDVAGAGVPGQQLHQPGEHRPGLAGLGDIMAEAQEIFRRRPQVGQHHRVAPGEVPVLRRLRGGAADAGVGAVHVDGQVRVGAAGQGLVDRPEEGQRVLARRLHRHVGGNRGLAGHRVDQDLRAAFAGGRGRLLVQPVPGLATAADVQGGRAQVQLVAGEHGIQRCAGRAEGGAVGGVEDLDLRVLVEVGVGAEQVVLAVEERRRRRHQPHRRLAGGEREHGQQGCKESDHGGLGFGTARGCRCRQAALFQKSRRVALAAAARRQGRRSP